MTGLAVLAALVMIVVSTAMNFHFMRSLAQTEAEGLMLGGASAAADVIKAALPLFITIAWRGRRYLYALIGSLVFAVFAVFSFLSALGFAADARGALAGSKEAVNDQLARAVRTETDKRAARAALKEPRPAAVLEVEIARLSQDRRYTTSKACTEATLQASREFCAELLTVKGELEQARAASRLDGELKDLSTLIETLRKRGAGGEVDAQVSVIARLLSVPDQGAVRNALVVFAALLVELGSSFGLWLALGHSVGGLRREGQAPPLQPDEVPPPVLTERPATLPAPAVVIEPPVRQCGEVVDYMVERVFPSPDSGLTLFALYRDYRSWCERVGCAAVGTGDFEREFIEVAAEANIVRDGDRFMARTGQSPI